MARTKQQAQVQRYLWRVTEVLALLLLVVVVLFGITWAMKYILPFAIGWFLAVLLLPMVKQLERRGVSRTVSTIVVMGGIILVIALTLGYLAVIVASEATVLSANIPRYFTALQTWVQDETVRGKALFGQLPPTVASQMQNTATNEVGQLETILKNLLTGVLNSVTQLPDTLFVVVVSLIATYFILVNREAMYARFLKSLPPGWSSKVQVVLRDMMRAFVGSIRVQIILMILSAVLGAAGLWVMGIQYAAILGVLFGLTGLVPVIGSALLTVPWAAGAFLVGDVQLAIKVLLLQVVISVIRHLVEPKILANSVGLDTLSTMFALYVGMKMMGVMGLFVGPILMIGIKSLLHTRLFVDFLPGSAVEPDVSVERATSRADKR